MEAKTRLTEKLLYESETAESIWGPCLSAYRTTLHLSELIKEKWVQNIADIYIHI